MIIKNNIDKHTTPTQPVSVYFKQCYFDLSTHLTPPLPTWPHHQRIDLEENYLDPKEAEIRSSYNQRKKQNPPTDSKVRTNILKKEAKKRGRRKSKGKIYPWGLRNQNRYCLYADKVQETPHTSRCSLARFIYMQTPHSLLLLGKYFITLTTHIYLVFSLKPSNFGVAILTGRQIDLSSHRMRGKLRLVWNHFEIAAMLRRRLGCFELDESWCHDRGLVAALGVMSAHSR